MDKIDHGGALIAVLGLAGSGKSSASSYLAGRGYQVVYFGGVVVEEVRSRGLEVTEENERTVREDLRRVDGMDVMAKRREPQIRSLLSSNRNVVIDGLYSWAELQYLRSAFGSRLATIAVHAPRWLRQQRIANRVVRPLTAGELEDRDVVEVRNLDKGAPIATADMHVINDGTLDDLAHNIDRALDALTQFGDWRTEPMCSGV